MGSFAFEGYQTITAVALGPAVLPQGPQDNDDSYVVNVRNDALEIAGDNGIGADLGYNLDIEAIREYLEEHRE